MTRRTVADSVSFEGVGLHSGVPVQLEVHPGDNGLWFRLGGGRWEAIPENVTDTSRCTKLGEISTIEHLMSAFAALGITDAEVELTAPELPAEGGCSLGYFDGISRAGFQELGAFEPKLPFKRVYLQDGPVEIAVARGEGRWRFSYDTGARWPAEQSFESSAVIADYREHIAPARTFALEEELPMIRQYGLGQGLNESSALVLGQGDYVNKARFEDEPARHKLLDLIGDLYLAGIPIGLLNVTARGSGHRTNVAAAKLLREHCG